MQYTWMIIVNSKEYAKHQVDVHINKKLQCQSCNKIFDNSEEFEKHATNVHSDNTSYYSKLPNSKSDFDDGNNSKDVLATGSYNNNNSIESKLK